MKLFVVLIFLSTSLPFSLYAQNFKCLSFFSSQKGYENPGKLGEGFTQLQRLAHDINWYIQGQGVNPRERSVDEVVYFTQQVLRDHQYVVHTSDLTAYIEKRLLPSKIASIPEQYTGTQLLWKPGQKIRDQSWIEISESLLDLIALYTYEK